MVFLWQVNLTIEEHARELLALNRKFGVTLLDAVTLLQESDAFLESVKVHIGIMFVFQIKWTKALKVLFLCKTL